MSRTVAHKTLRTLALALACTGLAGGGSAPAWAAGSAPAAAASAETGGAGVPAAHRADSGTHYRRHSRRSHRGGGAHGVSTATGRGIGGAGAGAGIRRGPQIATWFGPGFYGKKTACGQTLTPAVVGIASRTLPCGTLVLVAYDGHRLTVPVIDRGPYGSGAVWDLTRGAASALSIEDTVRVETKIVGHAANTPLLGVPAEVPPVAGATAAPAS